MEVSKEMKTVRELIMHVLKNYPDTRNCDNKLYVQCAKLLGAQSIDDMTKIGLSIVSVHKQRQIIQNKLHMFKADEEVIKMRKQRQKEMKIYYLAQ